MVTAQGTINLLAGKDINGNRDSFTLTSEGYVLDATLVPIVIPSSDIDLEQSKSVTIGAGADLKTAQDANLDAEELSTANLVSIVTDQSWVSAAGLTSTVHNGTVENNTMTSVTINGDIHVERINRNQSLTINEGARRRTTNEADITSITNHTSATVTVAIESVASNLINQRNLLLSLIDAYSGDIAAVAAYTAELQVVNEQMQSLGLATTVSEHEPLPRIKPSPDTFIQTSFLSPMSRSRRLPLNRAPSISVVQPCRAPRLARLDAPGNVTVTITNNSPAYLRLQGINIPDNDGGRVQWDGVNITQEADLTGFTGTFSVSADTEQPQITIINSYNADSPANAGATFTTPDVEIDGDINNIRGGLSINSQGNIVVAANFDVGTLNVKTGANFVLNSPNGQFSVGGDPAGANSPWAALAAAAATYGLTLSTTGSISDANISTITNGQSLLTAAEETTISASNVIAANSVVISAQSININGVLQSGIADYDVTITAAQQSQIDAANQARTEYLNGDIGDAELTCLLNNLTPDPSFQYFQFNSPHTQTTTDPTTGLTYFAQTGTQNNIPVYWDAVNKQIEVNAVHVQGGFMSLTGRILSTGQGQINVLDGFGRINIDNQTTNSLQVNKLDTGAGVAGVLQIVDTGNEDANGDPLETVYKRLNGNVQESQYRFLIPGEGTFDPAQNVSGTWITVQLSVKLGSSNSPSVQYTLGSQVLYDAGGSTPVGGLSDNTVYYVVGVNSNQVELAATANGTAIPLSAVATAGLQQTLIPLISISTSANTRTASYAPESAGYRFYWTTGQDQTSSTETTYATAKWLGSDALAKDPGSIVDGPVVTLATPRPLLQGSYFAASTDTSSFTYSFQRISANSTFDPHTGVSGKTITLTNNSHVWNLGDEVSFSANGHISGNVGNLTDGGNYFVVFVSADGTQIQLAGSANGQAIALTPATTTGLSDTFTSQPSTETEAQWSTSTWYGTTTYYTKVKTFSDQKDINTYSIKADQSIGIDFIGYDSGAVTVNSDGNLSLNGMVQDASGTTTLTAGGTIEQTSNASSIGGQSISLSAGSGIGDAGALQTNLADGAGGKLSAASTTGDIRINEVSGDLTIGQVQRNQQDQWHGRPDGSRQHSGQ